MTTSEIKTEAKAEAEVAVMMAYCHSQQDRLGDWDRSFIDDMYGTVADSKTKNKLQDLYRRLGGT
jgi:hypothetical protein